MMTRLPGTEKDLETSPLPFIVPDSPEKFFLERPKETHEADADADLAESHGAIRSPTHVRLSE